MATLHSASTPLKCLKYKRKFYEADDYLPWSPDVQGNSDKRQNNHLRYDLRSPGIDTIENCHNHSDILVSSDTGSRVSSGSSPSSFPNGTCQSETETHTCPPKKRPHLESELDGSVSKVTGDSVSSPDSFLHNLETPQSTQEICMALINMQFWRPETRQKETNNNSISDSVNNDVSSRIELISSCINPDVDVSVPISTDNSTELTRERLSPDPDNNTHAMHVGNNPDIVLPSAQSHSVIVERQRHVPNQNSLASTTMLPVSVSSSCTSECRTPQPQDHVPFSNYRLVMSGGRDFTDLTSCVRNYETVPTTGDGEHVTDQCYRPVQSPSGVDPHVEQTAFVQTVHSPSTIIGSTPVERVDPPDYRPIPETVQPYVQSSIQNVHSTVQGIDGFEIQKNQNSSQTNMHIVNQDSHVSSNIHYKVDSPDQADSEHSPERNLHSPTDYADSPTSQNLNSPLSDVCSSSYPLTPPGQDPHAVGRVLSLFPKPARGRLLWEIVEIMSRRHKEDYFTDWSAERILMLAPDERPNVFPVTSKLKKELVSKSVVTENKKLGFAWYSPEDWGENFRHKLRTGVHKTLSEAKRDASQLWREHCPEYDCTRAVRMRDNGGNIVMKRTRAKSGSEFEYRQNLRKAKANTVVHQIWSRRAIIADVLGSDEGSDLFRDIEAEYVGYKKPTDRIQQLADIIAFTLKRELLLLNADKTN